ncbi:porin family protein [Candidatus Hepatincola sp. Pdp]
MLSHIRNSIIIFILLLICSISVKAAPLIPDVYISAGVNIGSSKIKYYNTEAGISKDTFSESANNYQFAIGIRPLDMPIVGGFRFEASYDVPTSSDIEDTDIGLVLFYDFRIFPIITPYIGVGYHFDDYNFGNITGLSPDANTDNHSYSLHVGADFAIPTTSLSVFAEYEFQQTHTRATTDDISKYGINNQSLTIGLKYYIIT